MLSMLPIIYQAVLAGCAVTALLTAIIFLVKKKAVKSLALYAVCVLTLLGLGFLMSEYNPVPNQRHTVPEPVVVSPGSQTPPTPWAIEPEPAPVETIPVDAPDDPVAEPALIASAVEDVSESKVETPVERISTRASTAKISSASVSSSQKQQQSGTEQQQGDTKQSQSGAEQPQSSAEKMMPVSFASVGTSGEQQLSFSLAENPALASDSVYSLLDNPQLAPEPTLTTMTNPTPVYDPPLNNQSESTNPQDSSQNAISSPAQNNSGSSGGGPSATYIHDFSNGRVLITTASNNNDDPVYHTWDCRAAKTIPPESEDWYASAQSAEAAGRRLCGYCRMKSTRS